MIKNKMVKIVTLATLLGTSVMADTVIYPDYSLIGIEGGYTTITNDIDSATSSSNVNSSSNSIGLKIGAESYNYRIFLTANYYTKPDNSYDYIGSYGGEFDYLLNFSTRANFYLGVNAGIANMKFLAPNEIEKRVISDPYFGGDAGLNFHATKLIDLELGARLMMLDATNTKNGVKYTFNNFITGYASIIFKYEMK